MLDQAHKPHPKICFVGTASGDSQEYIDRFYAAFKKLDCEPSHLSVFNGPTVDLRSYVLDKDIIYVGGGNTRNLIVLWKEWGLDHIFREAWENGIVLAGLSAGSLCWFEQGVTDSTPGKLTSLNCLGFLKGSNCPHYDGEAERRPAYQRFILSGELNAGIAADDGVGVHYVGEQVKQIVSSRPKAKAYSVDRKGNTILEVPMSTLFLG